MSRALDAFRSDFETLDRAGGPLKALRRAGWERFAAQGLPTTQQEAWRFTNLAPLAQQSFALGRPSKNGIASAKGGIAPGLVFVDGHFRADLSVKPEGVEVTNLAEALRSPGVSERVGAAGEGEPLVALNAAFLEDGAFLRVAKGFRLPAPLHLLFLGTSKAAHPRNLYLIEEGAEADVVETYLSAGETPHLTNAVSEVHVAKGARFGHYRLQLEATASFHFGTVRACLERDARFTSHAVACGGGLTRSEIIAALDGENAHCTLNGLTLIRGTQHVDNYTRLEHRSPRCESHELYKGILDGRSSGVFTGRIHVFPDAQKTDAYQASANLLLTDTATVDAQPQLEIYADDVKCSHGSTVGQLDREALFYLRSRGLNEAAARHLLVRAFAGDVADRIDIPAVRQRIDAILAERLGGE